MPGEKDIVEAASLSKSDGILNFLYCELEFRCSKALARVNTVVGERRIIGLGEIASEKHRRSGIPVRFHSVHQHYGSAGIIEKLRVWGE